MPAEATIAPATAVSMGSLAPQLTHHGGNHAEKVHGISDDVRVSDPEFHDDTAGNRGENGQFRSAGEEGNHADRRRALLFVREGTGIDHRGHAAPESHDHGHERPARQTESAEYSVKNKRYARHITRILENREKQEKQQNLRQKGQNGEQAAENTVAYESRHPIGRAGQPALGKRRQTVGAKPQQIG